jgi:hypothetical protein
MVLADAQLGVGSHARGEFFASGAGEDKRIRARRLDDLHPGVEVATDRAPRSTPSLSLTASGRMPKMTLAPSDSRLSSAFAGIGRMIGGC